MWNTDIDFDSKRPLYTPLRNIEIGFEYFGQTGIKTNRPLLYDIRVCTSYNTTVCGFYQSFHAVFVVRKTGGGEGKGVEWR